jgi:RsiW-degrading membrane proteinase PrsW (M82 family)
VLLILFKKNDCDFNSKVSTLLNFLMILTFSIQKLEDPEKVEHRFGLLLTSIMYCFFVLPIIGIYTAFTKKCTQHMPLPIIVSGTLVGFCWLLHGIIINSGFVIVMSSKKSNAKLAAFNDLFLPFSYFRFKIWLCLELISFNCRCF